jgi:NAD(P)-dependent dehydrogenase (short-subunit alcohol dehydrogenase family)
MPLKSHIRFPDPGTQTDLTKMKPTYRKLLNKHVLIIGGTSGMGYAVAEASLASGADVTISSSNQTRINERVKQLQTDYPSRRVQGFVCDLSRDTVKEDIEDLFKKVSKLDHIVFTATEPPKLFTYDEFTLEYWRNAGQMRLFAPFFVAQVGSKYLNPGLESSIVLTTGTSSEKPIAGWPVVASYAASLKGLTRNLALDLKPIRVNIVSPGFVETELWDHQDPEAKKGLFEWVKTATALEKIGKPEEIAEAFLWLMKDTNVTGSVAETNSGMKLV